MQHINRREFLAAAAQAAAAMPLYGAPPGKPRLALVRSTHSKLAKPSSPEDPLDYERVRDMVWKAISYAPPRAGSLEAKIKPGSWVVIKPNIVFLRPQPSYAPGDITDFRVTKAVLEYVASRSRAGRITIAEGGTYRNLHDPAKDNVVSQNGVRVNAESFDWGTEEFPGFGGSMGGMLEEFRKRYPAKKFDYVDLSYDTVRGADGKFLPVEVPKTARGVGAFGEKKDYWVSNAITKCDFLIGVPVMKIHLQCGITACFKNYVGTAPREAYSGGRGFANAILHNQHSLEGRIDSFITDLAAFHPPDYNVVDGIRGLQYSEHKVNRPDQMIRSNMILAGEDAVATDALAAHLMGFLPSDIEFLQMAAQRDLGTFDLARADVRGDDPERARREWGKPRGWFGRCNREWLVTQDPATSVRSWSRYTIPTDTLHFARWASGKPVSGSTFAAAVKVRSSGQSKAFLWVGAQGKVTATLNGEKVMEEENRTRYRIGQFQKPVELKSGENLLVFQLQALTDQPDLSALLVGPRNDGDSLEGIRWTA